MTKTKDRQDELDAAMWRRFKTSMEISGYQITDEDIARSKSDYNDLGYRDLFSEALRRAEKEGRDPGKVAMEMREELRAKGGWPPTR